MRSRIALGLALALAGCGTQWSRPGTPPERAAQDLAECRHVGEIANRRDSDIDADILASRGQDWERLSVITTKRSDYAESNRGRTDDIVSHCMTTKGYAPGRP